MKYSREIRIGKGSIKISEQAGKIIGNQTVIIRGETVNGPCTDSDCQIIVRESVELGTSCTDGFVKIIDNNITLCIQKEIARAIDVGRQLGVKIELARNSLALKNFAYVS